MNFETKKVPIDSINLENTFYKISTPKPFDDLIGSINKFGLLSAPIIKQDKDVYIVLCGFRRISACRSLEWSNIETRIVSSRANELDCVKVSIADNSFNRQLNIVEQSTALSKLCNFYPNDHELSQAANELGLSVSPSFLKKIRKVYTMIPELQKSILSGIISLSVALEISILDHASATSLINLFESLKPTLNQQKEILLMSKEISKIANTSIDDLFASSTIVEILMLPDLARVQKIHKLRSCLKRMRFPVMAHYYNCFQDLVNRLSLPNNLKLIPPENLENTTYTMILSFTSSSEFESLKAHINNLSFRPEFKSILNKDFANH